MLVSDSGDNNKASFSRQQTGQGRGGGERGKGERAAAAGGGRLGEGRLGGGGGGGGKSNTPRLLRLEPCVLLGGELEETVGEEEGSRGDEGTSMVRSALPANPPPTSQVDMMFVKVSGSLNEQQQQQKDAFSAAALDAMAMDATTTTTVAPDALPPPFLIPREQICVGYDVDVLESPEFQTSHGWRSARADFTVGNKKGDLADGQIVGRHGAATATMHEEEDKQLAGPLEEDWIEGVLEFLASAPRDEHGVRAGILFQQQEEQGHTVHGKTSSPVYANDPHHDRGLLQAQGIKPSLKQELVGNPRKSSDLACLTPPGQPTGHKSEDWFSPSTRAGSDPFTQTNNSGSGASTRKSGATRRDLSEKLEKAAASLGCPILKAHRKAKLQPTAEGGRGRGGTSTATANSKIPSRGDSSKADLSAASTILPFFRGNEVCREVASLGRLLWDRGYFTRTLALGCTASREAEEASNDSGRAPSSEASALNSQKLEPLSCAAGASMALSGGSSLSSSLRAAASSRPSLSEDLANILKQVDRDSALPPAGSASAPLAGHWQPLGLVQSEAPRWYSPAHNSPSDVLGSVFSDRHGTLSLHAKQQQLLLAVQAQQQAQGHVPSPTFGQASSGSLEDRLKTLSSVVARKRILDLMSPILKQQKLTHQGPQRRRDNSLSMPELNLSSIRSLPSSVRVQRGPSLPEPQLMQLKAGAMKQRLLAAASSLESGDMARFEELTAGLAKFAKPRGTPMERCVATFLRALVFKAQKRGDAGVPVIDLSLTRISHQSLNKARMWFAISTPVSLFSTQYTMSALLPRLLGRSSVHLVLWGDTFVYCLPALFKILADPQDALALQGSSIPREAREKLIASEGFSRLRSAKISAIDPLRLKFGRQQEQIDMVSLRGWGEVARVLKAQASSLGVALDFEALVLEEQTMDSVRVMDRGDAQVVAAISTNQQLQISRPWPFKQAGPNQRLIELVRNQRPDFFVMAEEELDSSSPSFLDRFEACLDHQWNAKHAIEACARGDQESRRLLHQWESLAFDSQAMHVLALPQSERCVYPLASGGWELLLTCYGFRPSDVSSRVIEALQAALQEFPDGFEFVQRRPWTCLQWQGKTVASGSCWTLPNAGTPFNV